MKYLIVTDFNTTEQGLETAARTEADLTAQGQEVFRVHLETMDSYDQVLGYLYGVQPNVIFTYDLAGFHLADNTGELIYNKMYAENHHFLCQRIHQYPHQINRHLSFPSTIYAMDQSDLEYMEENYEQLYCVKVRNGTD